MGTEFEEAQADEPSSGLTTAAIVVSVITILLLAVSAWSCVHLSQLVLESGNDPTCGPGPIDRHPGRVVAVSVAAYACLVLPAIVAQIFALRMRSLALAILALALTLVSLLEPLLGVFYILFSIGMC